MRIADDVLPLQQKHTLGSHELAQTASQELILPDPTTIKDLGEPIANSDITSITLLLLFDTVSRSTLYGLDGRRKVVKAAALY